MTAPVDVRPGTADLPPLPDGPVAARRPGLLLPLDGLHDADELARSAAGLGYTTLDTASPTARFRGTFLTPGAGGGTEVVAWQRNVIRVQKMDSSLPTVIRMTLDDRRRIAAVRLERTFAGSRGVLCYQPYLTRRLEQLLLGLRLDEVHPADLHSAHCGCFHVSEVLSDVIGAQALADAAGLTTFAEQDCLDSVQDGDRLTMCGGQQVLGLGEVTYRIVVDGAFSRIRFDEQGAIGSRGPLRIRTYLDSGPASDPVTELVTEREVGGQGAEFLLSVQRATRPLLRRVSAALGAQGQPLACTNLAPQSLVGALVLALAAKFYPNNYVYILHCLSGLQRPAGTPKCLGGVQTQAEADTHFPGFDVRKAVLGE